MNKATPAQNAATATAEAMDKQRPFSWIISRPGARITRTAVQCGVYLDYTQSHFQAYVMPRMAERAEAVRKGLTY